jgi:hypothetical protein
MTLAKHFTLGELVKSDLALRHGIDNKPHAAAIDNLQALTVAILEPVRLHFAKPVIIRSGFRCAELNALCGSSPASQHMRGEAADFEIPGVHNLRLARWIRENLEYDQVISEYPSKDDPFAGWVHCSYVRGHNRKECLTINSTGTFAGLPEV